MATGLAAQYAAAQNTDFQNKVQDAIVAQAITVLGELNLSQLTTGFAAATAVTSLSCTALPAAYVAGDIIQVGSDTNGERFQVAAAGAAANATAIPVTSKTSANAHGIGEMVFKVVRNHANRVSLANRVLMGPEHLALMFADGMASQGLDDTSTDAAIQTSVQTLWDAYAGAAT